VRSLWLEEALAGEDAESPRLEGQERAEVCVVGGGYTGLWTALRLREQDPSLDVAVVEADVCGGGASGRNGGFVLSWWAKFTTLAKVCGVEEALRLGRASAEAVVEIGRFCDEHGIDAHYRADGWLWAATRPVQLGAWEQSIAELERHGVRPFDELEPEEVARRSGSPVHVGGVLEREAATVQPALLARGLRRVALDRGVRIYERSPMTALERSQPPRVVTPAGALTADRVVLALNAWAAKLRELRRALVVIASDMVATEPIPERLAEIGWRDGLCISDSRMLVNYYRTTRDGRIAFGKGGGTLSFAGRIGPEFHGASPRADEVADSLRSLYPALRGVRIATSWNGPIDRPVHGLPFFGRLGGRPDIVYGTGYAGNGVGPTAIGGRILASLARGLDDEWATCGLVRGDVERFPPEPARFLGGLLVRAAVARKERAEDAGRRPDALTVRLAALAPAGLVPLKEPAAGNGEKPAAKESQPA
jgi:putative aminophosphonate oxidoreductase